MARTLAQSFLETQIMTATTKTTTTKPKDFYTTGELAEKFSVKPVTIRRMADRGELPYYTFGRSIRFRHEDVEEFLQRCKGVARSASAL